MTWLTRAMLLCLLLGGATHALAQKEHWSQLMRAEGNKSHQSLGDIRAAYQAQHGSDARLRGTGLKQLERWSHWQAIRGGQTQRIPAAS
ncbi:MAG TPA: hypothetical protein DEP62_07995, partial [Flavobacteriales bacterium]|nr:hypothetical protein [Flavobacteriales bacterium]